MTRVTNFGRKRTYVEAGFPETLPDDELTGTTSTTAPPVEAPSRGAPKPTKPKPEGPKGEDGSQPPRRHPKRHRPNKKKLAVEGENGPSEGGQGQPKNLNADRNDEASANGEAPKSSRLPIKPQRPRKKFEKKLSLGEKRRLARIQERNDATTCFACREKGHAARDCPKAADADVAKREGNSNAVGICYRCGSSKHNLSRCRNLANPENPLPYASCFVCSGKGHLASACPQNKARGVYPNGGCCKICGDTTHLAKDCATRKTGDAAKVAVGTGREAGADEDDFMTLVRNTKQVEREERTEERFRRLADVTEQAPTRLGIPATGSLSSKTKKVVVF
ncbi:hypothetical protein FA15DRAFT_718072 [Coprinopsis marcescibilis]|uniref:CCHC-type domain-containing protein n=1 Tax=Coprinopsis marcescibilis TaxID=230819 RepID=A0A5C3KL59_COPMA|nr:hypothetical protein FA15DRAFT_718072 [Coprinopsis marcescibilis]